VQPLRKSEWRFLKKLKIEVSYDLAIPQLGIYPKECKSAYNRDTCTSMFTAALLRIAKLWNQRGCLPVDEWMKKMLNIYIFQWSIIQP
jgi:hypothetical protein